MQEISPAEVKKLFPLARVDDILAGFYVADDGRANPVDVTMALAKGARMAGARLIEGVRVDGVLRQGGRVTGVRTALGDIQAEYVVNCAGMWARQLGERDGVTIPNQAAEHYYLITEPIADLPPSMPVLEDPASYGYFREEVGGLLVGLFEPVCAPWNVDGIPGGFLVRRNPARLGAHDALSRKGDEPRADHARESGSRNSSAARKASRPTCGRSSARRRSSRTTSWPRGSTRSASSPAAASAALLAHWIVNGTPDADVTGFNIDRLHKYQANPEYRRERTIESLGMVYKCHYPTMTPHDRARREDLGDPRPAGGGARLFPRRQRLGGRRLVRAGGLRAEGREALLGPAELVSRGGRQSTGRRARP